MIGDFDTFAKYVEEVTLTALKELGSVHPLFIAIGERGIYAPLEFVPKNAWVSICRSIFESNSVKFYALVYEAFAVSLPKDAPLPEGSIKDHPLRKDVVLVDLYSELHHLNVVITFRKVDGRVEVTDIHRESPLEQSGSLIMDFFK